MRCDALSIEMILYKIEGYLLGFICGEGEAREGGEERLFGAFFFFFLPIDSEGRTLLLLFTLLSVAFSDVGFFGALE